MDLSALIALLEDLRTQHGPHIRVGTLDAEYGNYAPVTTVEVRQAHHGDANPDCDDDPALGSLFIGLS